MHPQCTSGPRAHLSQCRDWKFSPVPMSWMYISWTLHDLQKKAHDPFGGHDLQFGNHWYNCTLVPDLMSYVSWEGAEGSVISSSSGETKALRSCDSNLQRSCQPNPTREHCIRHSHGFCTDQSFKLRCQEAPQQNESKLRHPQVEETVQLHKVESPGASAGSSAGPESCFPSAWGEDKSWEGKNPWALQLFPAYLYLWFFSFLIEGKLEQKEGQQETAFSAAGVRSEDAAGETGCHSLSYSLPTC